MYQVAPCTSSYNLGNDDLLEKITGDCGHSENIRPDCRMQLKDPNDREILPHIENVDIRGNRPICRFQSRLGFPITFPSNLPLLLEEFDGPQVETP